MGKVWKPKGSNKPTPSEVYGRALAGFADTPQEEYQAYEKAMGPENVRHENYVQPIPPIRVNRRGKWVEPDEGLDVLDFTTDQLPQIPSIVGGIAGFSAAGPQGAVGGAMVGEGMRRKIGQQLGVGDGSINPTAMKIAGAGEVLGPALAAIPLPNIAALTAPRNGLHALELAYSENGSLAKDVLERHWLERLQAYDNAVRMRKGKPTRVVTTDQLYSSAEGGRIRGDGYRPAEFYKIDRSLDPDFRTGPEKYYDRIEEKKASDLWNEKYDKYEVMPEQYRGLAIEFDLPYSAKVSDLKREMAKQYGVMPQSRALDDYIKGAIDEEEFLRVANITRARHELTAYDDLLDSGVTKEDARIAIKDDMNRILGSK